MKFCPANEMSIPRDHGRSQNFGSGGTLLGAGLVGGPRAKPRVPENFQKVS